MSNGGQKWTVGNGRSEEVRGMIRSYGGVEDEAIKSDAEAWRMRIGKAVFTMYRTGTLYNNMAGSREILELRDEIGRCCKSKFESTGRDILIGVDETGKGEVAGDEVLCGVRFLSGMYGEVDSMAGMADTKSRRTYGYWDGIFSKAGSLDGRGLRSDIERIHPEKIDKYNINRLMDAAYKRIITRLMQGMTPDRASIVVDDYQIGRELKGYLDSLQRSGAKIIVTHKADERFLEARLASALAKRERERIMAGINDGFVIDGISIGSGAPSDERTKRWLAAWKKSGREWPWFIKRSYSNIRELDGLSGNVKKSGDPHSGSLSQWMDGDDGSA